jgi:hypothetical protein
LSYYWWLPGRFKGLPGAPDSENHYKCNLRNLIFTGVFLPGLKVYLGSLTVKTVTNAFLEIQFLLVASCPRIKGLPGVADCENHYKCIFRN